MGLQALLAQWAGGCLQLEVPEAILLIPFPAEETEARTRGDVPRVTLHVNEPTLWGWLPSVLPHSWPGAACWVKQFLPSGLSAS